MTYPDAIRLFCERNFAPHYVEQCIQDITNWMTGTTHSAASFYVTAKRDIDRIKADGK